jgi:hypothetical protein
VALHSGDATHQENLVSHSKPLVLGLCAGLVLGLASPAQASDLKYVSAAECQPYAPDTSAAELQITQNGVYNPGTTNEKVICPLPRDANVEYPGGHIEVVARYRVLGGALGRLSCSLFLGSTAVQTSPVISSTASGEWVANGARGSVHLISGGAMDPDLGPNNLICTISPKTQLGGIYVQEDVLTD